MLTIAEPTPKRNGVGIDLGTTNSLLAFINSLDSPELLQINGSALIPSTVSYTNKKTIVGSTQLGAIASSKRLMGKHFDDVRNQYDGQLLSENNGEIYFDTPVGHKSPVAVGADILRHLVNAYRQQCQKSIDGVVVTVPAYFDDAQRQATKQAIQLAGLPLMRLLNEPTAAAIAYGIDRQDTEAKICVYDLGGGTFDVSVLHLQKGIFEVLACGGDSSLGGDDFDIALAKWYCQQTTLNWQHISVDLRQQILRQAQQAKEALNKGTAVQMTVDGNTVSIDETKAGELWQQLIDRTVTLTTETLHMAELAVEDIDHLLLVGGSTKLARIQATLATLFGNRVHADLDADTVVALGAAIHADALLGNQIDSPLLLDVTPLSLGLETLGGLAEKIIPCNSKIPISRSQQFTTAKDGQTAIAMHIVQGEREHVENCRSLARFTLNNLPPMPAGLAKITVHFNIDADGILSVNAQEQTTGVSATIDVKPSFGLSEATIAKMLEDSIRNANDDIQLRQLKEKQLEATNLANYIDKALESDADLISKQEHQQLKALSNQLQQLIDDGTYAALNAMIKQLSKASETFAERRMDRDIKQALVDKQYKNLRQ